MEGNKPKYIIFFIFCIILGGILLYTGLASEMPEHLSKEGTVCESEECNFKAPDYIPKELEEEMMELIK